MDIRKALKEAIAQSDLPLGQKARLRLAMLFPGFLAKVEPEIEAMIDAEGVQATDWAAVIKFFIENVLPLILKLLAM